MTAPKKFSPPTPDEWMFYADSIGWMPREDAEAAYDHYLSVGWKVGGQPMRDWQAAARNCKRRASRSVQAPVASGLGRLRSGYPAATLGALQLELKRINEALTAISNPGGSAWPGPIPQEKLPEYDRLLARRKELKLAIDNLPLT